MLVTHTVIKIRAQCSQGPTNVKNMSVLVRYPVHNKPLQANPQHWNQRPQSTDNKLTAACNLEPIKYVRTCLFFTLYPQRKVGSYNLNIQVGNIFSKKLLNSLLSSIFKARLCSWVKICIASCTLCVVSSWRQQFRYYQLTDHKINVHTPVHIFTSAFVIQQDDPLITAIFTLGVTLSFCQLFDCRCHYLSKTSYTGIYFTRNAFLFKKVLRSSSGELGW